MSLAAISVLTFSGCDSSSNSSDNSVEDHALENNATEDHVTESHDTSVSDEFIAEQRAKLAKSTAGQDVGAQSPRDIDDIGGNNIKATTTAPASTAMNLCNIHFHKSAEHKGGEFTVYAGNGDGEGYGSGYKYSGSLSELELTHYEGEEICKYEHNPLYAGDTIEVHYVYTSDDVAPGESLGACIAADREEGTQPLLRVEAQVYVIVNDENALDFVSLNKTIEDNTTNLYQAPNIPNNTGTAIEYEGSTTGAGYNEVASPYQVTWNVRPNIAKVNMQTVGAWCDHNEYNEHKAHNVRNLLINPDLLSQIK